MKFPDDGCPKFVVQAAVTDQIDGQLDAGQVKIWQTGRFCVLLLAVLNIHSHIINKAFIK